MNSRYSLKTLVEIDKEFSSLPKEVVLTGEDLYLPEIIAVARKGASTHFTEDPRILKRIDDCYQQMMQQVKEGMPIYGCNTGYGAQASKVLVDGSAAARVKIAKKISQGIAHVDVSVGPPFSIDVIRAAILIRINMLLRGVSAIKLSDLDIFRRMLNEGITPIVNQYGGIGASGDLAHNGRILSAARQLPGVKVWDKNGKIKEAAEALKKAGIPALELEPKAGLGLVNGDNFSTALAAILTFDTLQMLLVSNVLGAMMIEVLRGTNRSFHPMLGKVRPHAGQIEVAKIYSYLLEGSKLAYQEMRGHKKRPSGKKVQDGYSLRAIAQYQGVNFEKIKQILSVIEKNSNSVSDNPLWVAPEYAEKGERPWQWVSGANFLAEHMVEVMDDLRKIITKLVKLHDRHLARLIDPTENNGLPANLSDKKAITGCTFKGIQIQSGMFDVYSSLLSIPVSTFFGVHEERNQDITSHALTSGILALENLRLLRYSTAQNLLAVCQAVDLRGGPNKLSPRTQPLYRFVRERVKYIEKEKPLNQEIELLFKSIVKGEISEVIRKEVFKDFH